MIYFQAILHAPVPVPWHCARPAAWSGCKGKVKHEKQRSDLNVVGEIQQVFFYAVLWKMSYID